MEGLERRKGNRNWREGRKYVLEGRKGLGIGEKEGYIV
jgi:hypothetical protein